MTFDIRKEHAVETFKSLIVISVAGLKLLALFNGGAAVALLAYLGNVAGKGMPVPDMRPAMGFYLAGLSLCGVAFLLSYATQLHLFKESMGRAKEGCHKPWLWSAIVITVLSLVAFILGSICAVSRF